MKDLVNIIKNNPGCIARIDNDNWYLEKDIPYPEDFEKWDEKSQDEWNESLTLASSHDELVPRGSGYGSGNLYGGDILQALALIVGITIESV